MFVPQLLLPLLLVLPTGTHQSYSLRGETMGTTYAVSVEAENPPVSQSELQAHIDERLEEINRLMSTYDPDSELSRFNESQSTDWFSVSAETLKVVQRALEISELSGGAFDPTVGRLVRLWSFGPDHSLRQVPSDAEISEALAVVGYQNIHTQTEPPAIKKDVAAVELDLSAIAKGYGVDAIAALVEEYIPGAAYMVEIGGEVRASGSINGHGWRVGIERPDAANLTRIIDAKVELGGPAKALATSGDYRNYFEQDGLKYSHTINPQTGKPVRHTLASASVIAEDCMTADALATTLMVLGPERGKEFAEQQHVAAYLISREGEVFQAVATSQAGGAFTAVDSSKVVPSEEAVSQEANLLTTFLITLSVFGVAIVGLAAGVLLSNRELKGSCGGVEGTKDENGKSICELCTTPPEECDRLKAEIAKAAQESAKS